MLFSKDSVVLIAPSLKKQVATATCPDKRSFIAIDQALIGDDYFLANARQGITTADERRDISFWIKNFTDETVFSIESDVSTFVGTNIYVAQLPRWFGGTFRFN